MSQVQPEHVLKGIKLTEKTAHLAERRNVYAFEVPVASSKPDIKAAIEQHFGVRVVKVNTHMIAGRPKRYRMHHSISRERKRALVTLHPEDRIALY